MKLFSALRFEKRAAIIAHRRVGVDCGFLIIEIFVEGKPMPSLLIIVREGIGWFIP
jgi:hypothetical protein